MRSNNVQWLSSLNVVSMISIPTQITATVIGNMRGVEVTKQGVEEELNKYYNYCQ